MGRLTPEKTKHFSVKINKKSMKCTVRLRIQAITCPGVVLPRGEDVYLSACVMGQYQKTACLPPAFPLLFHHDMEFVKTFYGVLDPSDVADLLEVDTTTFELIQLLPPEGEVLATIDTNTREFLYPGPRLLWRAGAPEREILMKRSISFPGISPKVEFTTTSIIQECDGRDTKAALPPCSSATPSSSPSSPCRRGPSPAVADGSCSSSGYQRATVASRSRALSPYTHRRMCQLSWDAEQRLAHLRLGPHRFRKDTETNTPFLVPCSPSSSMMASPSPHLSSPRHTRSLPLPPCRTSPHTDSSLLGSYRPKSGRNASKQEVPKTPLRGAPPPPALSTPGSAPGRPQSTPGSAPGRPQALSGSSLRERFQNSPSNTWEEIHRRVQNVLRTHQSHRKLNFDDEKEEAHGPPGEMLGPPDDGPSWGRQVPLCGGRPSRAVFEQSLENIYHDMYQEATGST